MSTTRPPGWQLCAAGPAPESIAPRSHWLLVVPQPAPVVRIPRKLAFQALAVQLREFSDAARRMVAALDMEEPQVIAFLAALGWAWTDEARSIGAALRVLGWVPGDGRRWKAYQQIGRLIERGILNGILQRDEHGRRCLAVEWFDGKESCDLAVLLDTMVLTGELSRAGAAPPYLYAPTENLRHV